MKCITTNHASDPPSDTFCGVIPSRKFQSPDNALQQPGDWLARFENRQRAAGVVGEGGVGEVDAQVVEHRGPEVVEGQGNGSPGTALSAIADSFYGKNMGGKKIRDVANSREPSSPSGRVAQPRAIFLPPIFLPSSSVAAVSHPRGAGQQ